MAKEPLLLLSGIGIVGYGVFHGHQLGQSCWICPYRGLIFLTASVGLGVFAALND